MPKAITSCGGILLDDEQFTIDNNKVIHVNNGGSADVNAKIQEHNTSAEAHSDIREKLDTYDNDITTLNTTVTNIIKGDYVGTDSGFIDVNKSDSGVKINITELGAVADATTDTIVDQFNALLTEMRTMGLLSQ